MQHLNICPKCQSLAKVKDTRQGNGEIYRLRACDSCGYTFYTVEFEAEDSPELRKAWAGTSKERYKNSGWAKKHSSTI